MKEKIENGTNKGMRITEEGILKLIDERKNRRRKCSEQESNVLIL